VVREDVIVLHEREALPETYHELIEFGILASRKDPFDPMEKALQQVGDDYFQNCRGEISNSTETTVAICLT
jgi:hypothetical protein